MSKNSDTTKRANDNDETRIEAIETVDLYTVTGGCARCGCGTFPGPNVAAFAALAATFER